jgi:hypothetical protein
MSDYNFDETIPSLRGEPIKWQASEGAAEEPWKIGEAMANALVAPSPEIRSGFSKRLLLAGRLNSGGTGRLTTEERGMVIEAANAVYGPAMPIVAGRIEQFIEREGPWGDQPAKAKKAPAEQPPLARPRA